MTEQNPDETTVQTADENSEPQTAREGAESPTVGENAESQTGAEKASPVETSPVEASPEKASTGKASPVKASPVKASSEKASTGKVRAEPVARARRPGKPKVDPVLAAAVALAHDALYEIADPAQVGDHLGVTAEEDRLLTHRFAADKPGYRGWEWFVTVARAPRAKLVTVCEIGLLPGEDALIAPPWVPWLERMNDEEREAHKAEQAEADEG